MSEGLGFGISTPSSMDAVRKEIQTYHPERKFIIYTVPEGTEGVAMLLYREFRNRIEFSDDMPSDEWMRHCEEFSDALRACVGPDMYIVCVNFPPDLQI